MNTQTIIGSSVYTVIDIRKTFEGFDADLRMIAKRTGKWTTEYVEKIVYDVIKLAEAKYLSAVDITLVDVNEKPVRATTFTVNEDGKAMTNERPGGNDWTNIEGTKLRVILHYKSSWNILSPEAQEKFQTDNKFKISWVASSIDTSYSHLRSESNQLYASKGYELQKKSYK